MGNLRHLFIPLISFACLAADTVSVKSDSLKEGEKSGQLERQDKKDMGKDTKVVSDSSQKAAPIATISDTIPDSTAASTVSKDTIPIDSAGADTSIAKESDTVRVESAEKSPDSLSTPDTPVQEIEEEEIRISGGDVPDYRSPRRAMFLSFLVPGLGQYYARSKIKAGVFAAMEIGLFGVRYYFNDQGKQKEETFRQFVNNRFDDNQFDAWYNFAKQDIEENRWGLDSTILQHYEFYEEEKIVKSQQYYEMTNKYDEFVHGWKDVEPTLAQFQNPALFPDTVNGKPAELHETYWLVYDGDTTTKTFGYSEDQLKAASLSAESNTQYRKADNVWFAVMLNHLCSGLDAALTARRYNRSLLEHRTSFLDRMHIENAMIEGINGPLPVVTFKFDF